MTVHQVDGFTRQDLLQESSAAKEQRDRVLCSMGISNEAAIAVELSSSPAALVLAEERSRQWCHPTMCACQHGQGRNG